MAIDNPQQGGIPSTNEEVIEFVREKLQDADRECEGSNPAICDLIGACQGLLELAKRHQQLTTEGT